MLSDKQHIDDFFRHKEEAFTPDEQHAAAHRQQMQQQLAEPGVPVSNKIMGKAGKFLGGLLTVAILAILIINSNKSGKEANAKTGKQQATVVVPPAPETKQPATVTAATIQTKPANTPKPHPVPAMTLIGAPVTKAEEDVTTNNNKLNEPETPKPDTRALLNAFFDEIKQAEQEFYIHVNRDTTLIAKDGTLLDIPAYVFMNDAGFVTGQVKIVIREYIQYDDIIANKLNTTSNCEQLITGGMLHISAQQHGKEVTVIPTQAIAVSIPTSRYDSQMMLFRGSEINNEQTKQSSINWIPVEPFHDRPDRTYKTTRTFNINYVEPVAVSYGKKTTAKFYINKHLDAPKEKMVMVLKKRFGSYYDNIKIKRVNPYKVHQPAAPGKYIVIDTVDMTPEMGFNKKLNRLNMVTDTVNKYSYVTKGRQQDQYSFTTNKLGWINCDRFANNRQPKITFNVNLGNEITFDDCFQQLVFTRYQSVLLPDFGYGNTVQYELVPEGEPVVLVTVAVKDGRIVSSFIPLNITTKEAGNLIFEPTTPQQFKQQLESLFISPQQ